MSELTECHLRYPTKDQKSTLLNSAETTTDSWLTVNNRVYSPKVIDTPPIGKRRELLLKFFALKAEKEAFEELAGDPPTPFPSSTEYKEHYHFENFLPFFEDPKFNDQELFLKNSLTDDAKTLYVEHLNRGLLKENVKIPDKRKPFRKRTLFTTPPEIANEEPENGF